MTFDMIDYYMDKCNITIADANIKSLIEKKNTLALEYISKKQYELMSEFLNFNLSETELAESLGGSRQSVHDAITKAKKQQ